MESESEIISETEAVNQNDVKWKDVSKLVENKIHTENLIHEIKKHSAIWNYSVEGYTNKTEKLNAWTSIINTFIKSFDEMSLAEKNCILTIVQKKWKNIRTSYTREIQRRKDEGKSGSTAKTRRQYIYFDQLRFLETSTKKATNILQDSIENPSPVVDNNMQNYLEVEIGSNPPETNNMSKNKRKSDNDEIIQILKKKIIMGKTKTEDNDEDKFFLLSLVSEMRKIPPNKKLKTRVDIISMIAAAQAPLESQWLPTAVGIYGQASHSSNN